MKCEFFSKKHGKFGRIKKSMLNRLLHSFPICPAICEYHGSKNLLFLLWTIHRTIFSHLRTNRSAAQQVRDSLMQTSGNRKESSLVSKNFSVECFRRVANRFCLMIWSIFSKKNFVLPSSVFWPFFKEGAVQIGQLLLVTFSMNCCPGFNSSWQTTAF